MIHINLKETALVNGDTGEVLRPSCFNDLIAYHAYLKTKTNGESVAQLMLSNVFNSERVISKMIENSQKIQSKNV